MTVDEFRKLLEDEGVSSDKGLLVMITDYFRSKLGIHLVLEYEYSSTFKFLIDGKTVYTGNIDRYKPDSLFEFFQEYELNHKLKLLLKEVPNV
jgi:hypothetical protein